MPVKLLMTSCHSATDIIAMHGVDKNLFQVFRDYDVDPRAVEAFRADKSGALIGDKIARRYGWKPGQQVILQELDGISFGVSGIFTASGSADEFLILAGRRFLQEAVDEQGVSNKVFIRLQPGADPAATSQAIDALPMTILTSTQPEEAFLSASMDQLRDLVSASKVVIVVIGAVILVAMGNAVSMATRERTRELAVLRTLGFQRGHIFAMVVGEGAFQSLAGGVLGCLVVECMIWANLVKSVSTCGFTVRLGAGPYVWAVALAATGLAAFVGSLAPAWNASRLRIVSAFRRDD